MNLRVPAFIRTHKKTAYGGLALILVIVGYLSFGGGKAGIATYQVVRGNTPEEVAVSGTVKAQSSADLGFASSGRIKGTYVTVGQHVEAGTVLAQIENGDERAALAKAEANLDALEVGTRPEELAAAQTAVEGDRASLIDAVQSAYVAADDAVHNRADALFVNPDTGPLFKYPNSGGLKETIEKERRALGGSLQDLDTLVQAMTPVNVEATARSTQAALSKVAVFLDNVRIGLSQALPEQRAEAASFASSINSARSAVADASASLTRAQNMLASDKRTLTLKQAGRTTQEVKVGQAEVANARAALAKTEVVAPFSGIVSKMDAKAGEIVSPATSEIAMQSDSTYEIEVYIPEVAIAGVAVGNAATTTLDAYGADAPFPARVVAVDPAETVKDGVPTYKTTLVFLKNDPRIRSGMTANVVVVTAVLKDAVVIPTGALGHDENGPYVSLRVGKKIEKRAVSTGKTPALGKVEITSGLTGGETILLTPK